MRDNPENYDNMKLSEPYKTAMIITALAVAFIVAMLIMYHLAGGT